MKEVDLITKIRHGDEAEAGAGKHDVLAHGHTCTACRSDSGLPPTWCRYTMVCSLIDYVLATLPYCLHNSCQFTSVWMTWLDFHQSLQIRQLMGMGTSWSRDSSETGSVPAFSRRAWANSRGLLQATNHQAVSTQETPVAQCVIQSNIKCLCFILRFFLLLSFCSGTSCQLLFNACRDRKSDRKDDKKEDRKRSSSTPGADSKDKDRHRSSSKRSRSRSRERRKSRSRSRDRDKKSRK